MDKKNTELLGAPAFFEHDRKTSEYSKDFVTQNDLPH